MLRAVVRIQIPAYLLLLLTISPGLCDFPQVAVPVAEMRLCTTPPVRRTVPLRTRILILKGCG